MARYLNTSKHEPTMQHLPGITVAADLDSILPPFELTMHLPNVQCTVHIHDEVTTTREIKRDSFSGIGKPEPLEHALVGYWSRRITDEPRIVYKVQEDALFIAQLRYHYSS